jgi:hypothetical protein
LSGLSEVMGVLAVPGVRGVLAVPGVRGVLAVPGVRRVLAVPELSRVPVARWNGLREENEKSWTPHNPWWSGGTGLKIDDH